MYSSKTIRTRVIGYFVWCLTGLFILFFVFGRGFSEDNPPSLWLQILFSLFLIASFLLTSTWKELEKKDESRALDYHTALYVLARIKFLRSHYDKKTSELPISFHKNTHSYSNKEEAKEEWLKVLEKIIWSLETIAFPSSTMNPYNDPLLDMAEKTWRDKKLDEIDQQVQEGLNLFGKYFQNLHY